MADCKTPSHKTSEGLSWKCQRGWPCHCGPLFALFPRQVMGRGRGSHLEMELEGHFRRQGFGYGWVHKNATLEPLRFLHDWYCGGWQINERRKALHVEKTPVLWRELAKMKVGIWRPNTAATQEPGYNTTYTIKSKENNKLIIAFIAGASYNVQDTFWHFGVKYYWQLSIQVMHIITIWWKLTRSNWNTTRDGPVGCLPEVELKLAYCVEQMDTSIWMMRFNLLT